MTPEQNAFARRVKYERERRGIGLEEIANATKIKESLLAALERGDVSQWPSGIFRRSFVREYASTVGLPPEPTVAEFVRLFPEKDGEHDERHREHPPSAPAPAALDRLAIEDDEVGLRLTLASEGPHELNAAAQRTIAAVIDALAVLSIGSLGTLVSGAHVWAVTGIAALVYFGLGTATGGRTLVSTELIKLFMSRARSDGHDTSRAVRLRENMRIVARQSPPSADRLIEDLSIDTPTKRRAPY